MTALKAFASQALNRLEIDGPDRRRWARHGSTRYLWTPKEISAAIHYVMCQQGEHGDLCGDSLTACFARGSVRYPNTEL